MEAKARWVVGFCEKTLSGFFNIFGGGGCQPGWLELTERRLPLVGGTTLCQPAKRKEERKGRWHDDRDLSALLHRSPSLLWLCCRFLDGGRRVWFGSAWRTLAVVVHALVATCYLSQEQGTERSHLGLDLRLGMPGTGVHISQLISLISSPLALEHLLKFEALNRHLSLPLWYRQTRDLGKARVGGASGNHCWSWNLWKVPIPFYQDH